jgi:hypothetical protein
MPFAVVKGLLFSNVFLILQVVYDFLFRREFIIAVFLYFLYFLIFFLIWQTIVQLTYFVDYFVPFNLVFISHDDSMMMRSSLFTQSLYLSFSVFFFLYLYHALKNNFLSLYSIKYFIKIGLIFYVFYGFYEWFLFFLTGINGDFLSNRITGEDYSYGLFQNISLGGFDLMRLKSLAGEPSMLAYTLVPFFIYYYYLNDKFWVPIFIALLMSTSSSAFLGLAVFFLFDFFFIRKAIRLAFIISFFVLILYALFYDLINDLITFNTAKLAMEDQSGGERSDLFLNHFDAWLDSNFIQLILGHGWGYVRSTDLFSTILYNTGFLGFLVITLFFLYPAYKLFSPRIRAYKSKADYYALSSSLVVIYFMSMISVTEPYYFHVWYFLALSYFYVLNGGKNACCKR